MTYTHEVTYGDAAAGTEGWAYTEVIEVPELEALLRENVPCRFRVPKGGDHWDDAYMTRTITRVIDLERLGETMTA